MSRGKFVSKFLRDKNFIDELASEMRDMIDNAVIIRLSEYLNDGSLKPENFNSMSKNCSEYLAKVILKDEYAADKNIMSDSDDD